MKYTGLLTLHFEQGGGPWPQFHDDRGLHGDEKEYWSWDWTINFGKKTKIESLIMWDKSGEVVYNNSWTFSKENTAENGYISSPKEIPAAEWKKLLITRMYYTARIITDEIVDALKPKKDLIE